MRVYKRADFLQLPAGTVYCAGGEWFFGGICFKGDTMGNDWSVLDPAWVDGKDSGECFARLGEMLDDGVSYPMEEDYGRDGLFDEGQIFLVFEGSDLKNLRGMIDKSIEVCEGKT